MASKKKYWLKLEKDFLKSNQIQIIRAMPNGKDYIIFYLALMLESISTEGHLRLNELVPLDEEMLAVITDTNIDTVRVAIKMFEKLGMLQVLENGTLFLPDVPKRLGKETESAERVRQYREKLAQNRYNVTKPLQCNENVTNLLQCNDNKEKEKKKDKNKEQEREKDKQKLSLSQQKFIETFPDKAVDCEFDDNKYNIDLLIAKIKDSEFLTTAKNITLKSCLKLYDKIIADHYKNYKPNKQAETVQEIIEIDGKKFDKWGNELL